MKIKNKLTVARGEGGEDNKGKKRKGQTKECEQRTDGHRQWERLTMGVGGRGREEQWGKR